MADWGICINVLMVVDPEKLPAIMAEMRRTCRNLVIEVYDMPDMRLGENRTLVVGRCGFLGGRDAQALAGRGIAQKP